MIIFMDSFDHYGSSHISGKGWSGLSQASIQAGGRTNNCLRITENNVAGTTGAANYPIPNLSEAIFGFAVFYNNGNHLSYIEIRDGSTVHLTLYRNSSTGVLEVWRGANGSGTLLGSSTTSFTQTVWQHIGIRVVIHDTLGEVELWMGGAEPELSLTGVDTRNGGNAQITNIQFRVNRSSGSSGYMQIDDFYAINPASEPNDEFLGDCTVQSILPNGNGNSSLFDGSDGNTTDNYLLVDEVSPDDDTTYVESSDIGDKDTYLFGDIPQTTGEVYGIQMNVYAKKGDAGARAIAPVVRTGSTEEDGSNITLGTSYDTFSEIFEEKAGGGVWTITDVNSSEFGVKVIS